MFSKILKTNPFRDAKGRWSKKENASPEERFSHDMNMQMGFLSNHAKKLGLPSVDALMEKKPEIFLSLAQRWRLKHPLMH
jgi:hypothetical protein